MNDFGLEVRWAGFHFPLCSYHLALWPWAGHSASLIFSFLSMKMLLYAWPILLGQYEVPAVCESPFLPLYIHNTEFERLYQPPKSKSFPTGSWTHGWENVCEPRMTGGAGLIPLPARLWVPAMCSSGSLGRPQWWTLMANQWVQDSWRHRLEITEVKRAVEAMNVDGLWWEYGLREERALDWSSGNANIEKSR